MRHLASVAILGLCFAIWPSFAEGQVYRDESSFLAAVGEIAFEGFENFPTEDCSFGGATPASVIRFDRFRVATEPLEGGTSFLCVGTTILSPGPAPTKGTNALIAGSNTVDRVRLIFSMRRSLYAVGFYITNASDPRHILFATDRNESATLAPCCEINPGGSPLFFGFVATKPFKTFSLTNTGQVNGWGFDEVMLASLAKSGRR